MAYQLPWAERSSSIEQKQMTGVRVTRPRTSDVRRHWKGQNVFNNNWAKKCVCQNRDAISSTLTQFYAHLVVWRRPGFISDDICPNSRHYANVFWLELLSYSLKERLQLFVRTSQLDPRFKTWPLRFLLKYWVFSILCLLNKCWGTWCLSIASKDRS